MITARAMRRSRYAHRNPKELSAKSALKWSAGAEAIATLQRLARW